MNIPIPIKREDRLSRNQKLIKSFKNLKQNWYGHGEKPIPEEVIVSALGSIPHLLVQPEVFPATDSSIQFDFNNFETFELEVNIEPKKIIIYSSVENVENTSEIPNPENNPGLIADTINEYITKYYS